MPAFWWGVIVGWLTTSLGMTLILLFFAAISQPRRTPPRPDHTPTGPP